MLTSLHTVEQLADDAPRVPTLDVPVSPMVGQLVELFRHIDTVVPKQVIDVPKIISHDIILQRAVLSVPQMVEQLSDVPVPSPRDCDADGGGTGTEVGHSWPSMVAVRGCAGVVLVASGHTVQPVDPSYETPRQPRAGYKYFARLRRLRLSRTSL